MVRDIGKRQNTSGDSFLIIETLNSTTSTTLVPANTPFTYLLFVNDTNFDVWIKLQPAAVDDNKEWVPLKRKSTWPMSTDSLYTTEISGISENGSPVIKVVGY